MNVPSLHPTVLADVGELGGLEPEKIGSIVPSLLLELIEVFARSAVSQQLCNRRLHLCELDSRFECFVAVAKTLPPLKRKGQDR